MTKTTERGAFSVLSSLFFFFFFFSFFFNTAICMRLMYHQPTSFPVVCLFRLSFSVGSVKICLAQPTFLVFFLAGGRVWSFFFYLGRGVRWSSSVPFPVSASLVAPSFCFRVF